MCTPGVGGPDQGVGTDVKEGHKQLFKVRGWNTGRLQEPQVLLRIPPTLVFIVLPASHHAWTME